MQKVESLAGIAREIDSNSDAVAEEAQQATITAEFGQAAVNQSVTGMSEIQTTVNEIVKRILALNEKTQDAGKLVAVIESIAEETHLLALNAAIESAGAGEEGSRFGVVASRVRQLANRTRDAVRNTQVILHEIQLAAGTSVMATEQGFKRATEGMELADRSGAANETILQVVSRTADLAQSISSATTTQLQATENLVLTMHQLTETINENVFGAQQTTISAAQLDETVEQLLQAAHEFQLGTDQTQSSTPTLQLLPNTSLVRSVGSAQPVTPRLAPVRE
jgi:methyl-accepting chemotaxis protein